MAKHNINRKYGRNKAKCERYRREHRRERNKLRRILQSNGEAAARAYAEQQHAEYKYLPARKAG